MDKCSNMAFPVHFFGETFWQSLVYFMTTILDDLLYYRLFGRTLRHFIIPLQSLARWPRSRPRSSRVCKTRVFV